MPRRRLGYNPKESPANVNQILDRLKLALNIKTDTELAKEFMVSHSTLTNWRHRLSMDFIKMFSICDKHQLDTNFIIFNKANISDEIKNTQRDLLKMAAEHEQRTEAFIEALRNLVSDDILDRLTNIVRGDVLLVTEGIKDPTLPDGPFEQWVHVFLDKINDIYPKKTAKAIRDLFFSTLSDVYTTEDDANNTTEAIIRKMAG